MNDSIFVNFHCHSIFSDGEQPPEVLAANLAAAGVRYAALTDHDSIESWPRFQETLKKRGVACLPGVELTTQFHGSEAHLLGYGFDPENSELNATLVSLRHIRSLEVHSIAGSLRKAGSNHPSDTGASAAVSAAPQGILEVGDAIALIHRAGGRVFWAHPLLFESDLQNLDDLAGELKLEGLDGLEAIYAPFSQSERAALCQLAKKHDLLVCAGTDFHVSNTPGNDYGIEMPHTDWFQFRQAFFSSAHFSADADSLRPKASNINSERSSSFAQSHHFQRRSYILRIFLPTLIAMHYSCP